LRLFIAALLPREIQAGIDEYIKTIRPRCEGVKWERREKLHITLKFLGNVDDSKANRISSVLSGVVDSNSSLSMEIQRFGGFPVLSNPRVIFVGLSDNPSLSEIHEAINNELEPLGFEKARRKFIPHVTIGRVKSKFRVKGTIPPPKKVKFEINEIALMESVLKREGSIYAPLETFRLG
jgi:2'-5' RNA ligase